MRTMADRFPVMCSFPVDGDEYVLSGWDSTKITELGLVGAAEQELKEKTEKYAAKSKIDPSTYGRGAGGVSE